MLTQDQLKEKVIDYMSRIEDYLIYYPLRELKLKHIRDKTIETIKCCIVLDYIGLPITINLVSFILEVAHTSVSARLHVLGDKRVLLLKGYTERSEMCYELYPAFDSILKIGLLDEIIEWRENQFG